MAPNPAHTALWPAPHASGAVDATVHVPGSKSVTNRALVLAALASEPGWLRRPLRSRDTLLMAGAPRALGVGIAETVSSSFAGPGGPDAAGEACRRLAPGMRRTAPRGGGHLPYGHRRASGCVRVGGRVRSW